MTRQKPTFIIEWSIWDETIGHHYEDGMSFPKTLMYNLTIQKQQNECGFGIITPELQAALNGAFGNRASFSFLIENTINIETYPPLPLSKSVDHRVSVILLTAWKTLQDSKNTFLVTEDEDIKKMSEIILRGSNLQCTVINSEAALKILNDMGYGVL